MEYKQCEHTIEPRPGRVNEFSHRCELEVSKIDKAGKYCARHSPEGKAIKAGKDKKRDEERANWLREREIEQEREKLNIKIAEAIKLLIDNGYTVAAPNTVVQADSRGLMREVAPGTES